MEDDATGFESGTGLTTLFEGEWATVRRMRKGKLVVVGGADQGKEIEISKPRVTGGRSIISDLVVQDKAVSGTHLLDVVRPRSTFHLTAPLRESKA